MRAGASFTTSPATANSRCRGETSAGRPINYQEWDVNRHVPGKDRGAERLVTGSDGSAYYTSDHYRTFTRVRSSSPSDRP